jgi:hypothetical protein
VGISIRQKFWFTTVFVVVVGLAIGTILGELRSRWLELGVFGWLFIGTYLMARVKCSNCGTPVVYQGKIGSIPLVAGFVRKRCQKCDFDLTQRTIA